jgi:nucleoid-associated protein YgaU
MAVDLRRSGRPACRAFLEKTLLTLEGRQVLEATKENHPPHYHVSLYPEPYMRYIAAKGMSGSSSATTSVARYRVRGGDSLWDIAQRHGTSVARLKQANRMSSSRLKPGQMLEIPQSRTTR